MLYSSCSRALLLSLGFYAALGASATPVVDAPRAIQPRHEHDATDMPSVPDIHSHSSSQPLLELNETDVLRSHAPDPLSYWAHDFERDDEEDGNNWRGLMGLHVVGMCFACFVLLPVGKRWTVDAVE